MVRKAARLAVYDCTMISVPTHQVPAAIRATKKQWKITLYSQKIIKYFYFYACDSLCCYSVCELKMHI